MGTFCAATESTAAGRHRKKRLVESASNGLGLFTGRRERRPLHDANDNLKQLDKLKFELGVKK